MEEVGKKKIHNRKRKYDTQILLTFNLMYWFFYQKLLKKYKI